MLVYEVFAFSAESHMIFPFDLFNHKALLPLNYHSLTCIAPVKEARYESHLFNSRFLERKQETKALFVVSLFLSAQAGEYVQDKIMAHR